MKRNILSLVLALTLLCSLCVPAVAIEAPADTDARPYWQQCGSESLASYLSETDLAEADYYRWSATPAEQTAWTDVYFAAHPETAATFSADAYFAAHFSYYTSKAEYMRDSNLTTDADFQRVLRLYWVCDQLRFAADEATVAAWALANPEKAAAFDPDAHFAAIPGIADTSKEAYMAELGLVTEADFRREMLLNHMSTLEYTAAAVADWTGTVAADPKGSAQFLAELPAFVKTVYPNTNLDDYMAQYGYAVAEEAYNELYPQWKDQQAALAQRNARITALGGVLGQTNVLVNDKCLAFGDQKPKAVDGVLSLPADVLGKALGTAVTAGADGYASLRATAEAAGFVVLWDGDYNTAVLIDRAAAVERINKNFTGLNKLWEGIAALDKREDGQSYQVDSSVELRLNMLNSLDGDKTYTVKVGVAAKVKDGAVSGTITLDLAGLLRQLSPEVRDALMGALPPKLTFAQLTTLFTGCKIDFILNPSEAVYLKAPILASFLDGYDGETWLRQDLSMLSAYMKPDGPVLNLGEWLCAAQLDNAYRYSNGGALNAYTDLMKTADTAALFAGNDRFTEKNGTTTYKLDAKTVNTLLTGIAAEYALSYGGSLFRTCDITATLTAAGKITLNVEMRPDMTAIAAAGGSYGPGYTLLMDYVLSLFDFRYTAATTGTADRVESSMRFHWKNQLQADLSSVTTTKKTSAAPALTPPEGGKVMDWHEIQSAMYAVPAPGDQNLNPGA